MDNAHEPLISMAVWQEVQEINKHFSSCYSPKKPPERNLFSGKLICADCRVKMVSNSKPHYTKAGDERRTVFYNCGTFTTSGHSVCSWHTVDENRLKLLVANEIRRQAEKIHLDKEAVIAQIANYDKNRLEELRQEIRHTNQYLQELTERSAKLYEDKVSGALERNAFVLLMRQNEQERSKKSEQLQKLKNDLAVLEQSAAAAKQWTADVSKYLNLQEIDRAIIDELIDHIGATRS